MYVCMCMYIYIGTYTCICILYICIHAQTINYARYRTWAVHTAIESAIRMTKNFTMDGKEILNTIKHYIHRYMYLPKAFKLWQPKVKIVTIALWNDYLNYFNTHSP